MKTRERFVIYTLLLGLLGLNLHAVVGLSGPAAHADAQDAAPPVSALPLLDAETGDELVLRNRGGRLSWGEDAHDRAYNVAYVFIGKVLKQLMESEAFVEERERLVVALNEADAEYRERLDGIRARIDAIDRESEEARRLFEEGQAVYAEYVDWQQQAMSQRGQLDAQHLETAYRELVEAVQVVADRMGIDTVYRFIPTDDSFEATNPEQAMLAIRLRTALRYPDELDITNEVLEELSLEVE